VDKHSETLELVVAEPIPEVDQTDLDPIQHAGHPARDRGRERVHAARCLERVRQEPVNVRVAAVHAVQHDHVVLLQRCGRPVTDEERGPIREAAVLGKAPGLLDGTGPEVDPGGLLCAPTERGEGQVTAPASDVQDRSTLESHGIDGVEEPTRDRTADLPLVRSLGGVRGPAIDAAVVVVFHDRSVVRGPNEAQAFNVSMGRRGRVAWSGWIAQVSLSA
jgi:hypothetical protein